MDQLSDQGRNIYELDLLIDFVDTAVDAGANAIDDIEIVPELDDAVETLEQALL